jgi:hypothetical protein
LPAPKNPWGKFEVNWWDLVNWEEVDKRTPWALGKMPTPTDEGFNEGKGGNGSLDNSDVRAAFRHRRHEPFLVRLEVEFYLSDLFKVGPDNLMDMDHAALFSFVLNDLQSHFHMYRPYFLK